jgi:hypothetical protein
MKCRWNADTTARKRIKATIQSNLRERAALHFDQVIP